MGHGPSLNDTISANETAKKAVDEAVSKATATLNNTETTAVNYINSHTLGIIEQGTSTYDSYSKFSEDYSVAALSKIVDGLVKATVDYMNPVADDLTKVKNMVGDVGAVFESVLALFVSSAATTSNLQVSFNHILSGEENYAAYYAVNSTTVSASNAWGNKEITVVANAFLLAKVKPNPEVTYAKILQEDLDTLYKVNKQYDDAILAAETQEAVQALSLYQQKIALLTKKIQAELTTEQSR